MRRAFSYLFALVVMAVALLLRALLDPVLGDSYPLVTLFGAVAGAVMVGGVGPAVLAAVTGYLAASYMFIPPRGALTFDRPDIIVGLAAYLFTCALIVAAGETARRARAHATDRRETLQVTLASIGDGVITTDTHGNVTFMNAVAERLTGWSDDARGKPLAEVFRIVNESSRQPVVNPAVKALREGTIVGLANHTILIAKDGREIAIDDSAAPIRDEHGFVSGCVLIFRDVTERRRLEREAAERFNNAKLLASIVSSSDDAIVSKTLDGRIRSWNAGAERLFGYSAEEAVGRHISLIIPPDRLAEEDRIIAALAAGGRVEHYETERMRRNGERVTVSLTISPLRDANGKVVAASKIARDITERKQMEEHLRRLAANLAETDRQKGEFLATLAHELRNPLAPLRSGLDLLKHSGTESEGGRMALETMERQLNQLVRLVDDLIDVNRVMYNRLELRPVTVDLASVIQQAVEMATPLAECANQRLKSALPAEPLFLHADPVRLTQVFANLLNNSCKYTPPGGDIRISAERDGNQAVVKVRDTGSGIPPEKIDTIFDMFSQAHRPERTQGGLGIGLALVKRLVTMHGGTVSVHSEGLGKGSEFVVTLPALATVQQEEPASQRPVTPSRMKRRVLVVDDNRDGATALALLLQHSGHEAFIAYDGPGALTAFETHQPDVVLLDIGLPGMTGHDVCRQIRQQPSGANTRVIALTGWGQEEDRRKSRDAGFDGHLVKPVDLAALLQQFEDVPAVS